MGKTRRRKPVGVYRVIFAENLGAYLRLAYPAREGETIDRPALFVRDHPGIASKSTLNRWINAEVGPNLDQIESMAKALRVTVRELLTPRETVPQPATPARRPQQQQSEDIT